MNRSIVLSVFCGTWFLLFLAEHLVAQDPPPVASQGQAAAQSGGPPQAAPGRGERRPGVFGKLTAVHVDSIEVSTPEGATVTVKTTSDTQFRKEREASKLSDFKVGDMVFVRGEENPDHTWTAKMIGSRPSGLGGGGQGPAADGGRGGAGGGGMRPMGVLGQDYVVGEIKAVDAPKVTILRPDNVTQTIELNEETSLHKGRDSITMADIQPGDHILVRGASANSVFQPKSLMVIPPEIWERMQEMGMPGPGGPPPKPQDNPKPPNPLEPRH